MSAVEPKRRIARLYVESSEVDHRLHELGLKASWLIDAVQHGELQRRFGSPLDPKPFPASSAWARTVRVVRQNLLDEGWHPEEENGLPTAVNEDNTIAIAVSTGDKNAGRDTGTDPITKNPKGEATTTVIKNNTPSLLDELDWMAPMTWVLLFNSGPEGLFAELSCPVDQGLDGRINQWSERIILGKIDLGEGEVPLNIPSEPEPEIDVIVSRRSS